ncbi:MAG TPA: phosphoglucomutase/phosphomannomutase family protein [Verrucomicrobiales bacterium]|nr:phosphoglucomutase/phosphomannomutase family protein [Verrucomicrobiales bacterium]
MSNPPIKFGTSGWRGLIARDFTFNNVRLIAQSTAEYLQSELENPKSSIYGFKPEVIVGYDTRFLGPEFAATVCEILEINGLTPLMCHRDTPTPVISFAIRTRKAIAGINLTASHNPPEYQGFKLSMENGAGAPADVTRRIEKRVAVLQKKKWQPEKVSSPGVYSCKTFDPKPRYLNRIRKLVDLKVIGKAQLKIGLEFMFGTGRGYLDELLRESGTEITSFHDYLNPGFEGHGPEPSAEGMEQVRRLILSRKAKLGLGLDGDADRFGIVDQDGTWLTPNQILPLTLYHLKKNRGWTGAAVRTVPTSHQIDAVAELLGVMVHETPVGFKHIGALMESEPIIVGGEESGGLSVKGHIPEKDGILACLLMAELVATEGKSLKKILTAIEKKTGPFYTDRLNIKVIPKQKDILLKRLAQGLDKIGSRSVEKFITTDGFKFLLPGEEWVAFRASGTEPVFRCYIEAKSESGLKRLKRASTKILSS